MAKTKREQAVELSGRGYTIELRKDKTTDGGYIFLACNPDLEGCMVQGLTETEALSDLEEARIDYIEHLLEHNLPVPYPNRVVVSSVTSKEDISLEELITLPGFDQACNKKSEFVFLTIPAGY